MLILISQSDVLKMCLFNPTNSPKSSKSFDLDWNDWLDQQNMLEQLHRLRLVSLLSLFGSDFSNFLINYWLIAVDSDHLCIGSGDWLPDYLTSGSSLGNSPPSQSELEDSLLGRLQVGSGTQVGLWICPWYTADVIPIDCQPESLSIQACIEISLLPHFIPVEEKWCLFLSELSDHTNHLSARLPIRAVHICASVACLTNSRTPAGFLLFVYIWFI